MENKLRTIIVTGALRGLAFELSKVLIAEGKHRVFIEILYNFTLR